MTSCVDTLRRLPVEVVVGLLVLRFQNGLLPSSSLYWPFSCFDSMGLILAFDGLDGFGCDKYFGSVSLASLLTASREPATLPTRPSTLAHSLSSATLTSGFGKSMVLMRRPCNGETEIATVFDALSNALVQPSKSFWLLALRCHTSAPESTEISLLVGFAPRAASDRGIAPRRAQLFRLW